MNECDETYKYDLELNITCHFLEIIIKKIKILKTVFGSKRKQCTL